MKNKQGTNKQNVLLGVSIVLLIISLALFARGPSKKQLQKEFRSGYSAGRKAEQAKWSDVYLQLAKKSISDQIESQPSIERLLKGDFKDLKVSYVENKGKDKAFVWLEGQWKDKSYIAGYFEFKKVNDYWFLVTTRKTAEEKLAPKK